MHYLLIALVSVLFVGPVYASEVTGTINTGISTGIEGSVAATPTASVPPGTFDLMQSVTLTATSSNSIRYTTDGTTNPTCTTAGTVYSGAISVSTSLTIRAIGCYNGTPSAVGIFAYGIDIPTAPPPAPPPPPSGGGGGGGGGGGSPPPSTPAQANGDITGDNVVNLLDFNALVFAWGSTGASLPADLNHNGVVDLLDFNILVFNWTI